MKKWVYTKIFYNCLRDSESSLTFFSWEYLSTLEWKLPISIVSRYYLSLFVFETYGIPHFLAHVDAFGKPLFDWFYWSFSHTWDTLFIWLSDSPLWVDMEVCKERDSSLLILWERAFFQVFEKNWKNFYLLWTAKESIIKRLGLRLDTLEHITFCSVEEQYTISWKETYVFLFDLWQDSYRVVSEFFHNENGSYITSICN